MTSSSDILNKRYLDFNEGFDQWRLDTGVVPNVYEKKDLTTGAWVETVPVAGGGSDDDGGVNTLAPYRAKDYPPTADVGFMVKNPTETTGYGNRWTYISAGGVAWTNFNYSAIGDYGVAVTKQSYISYGVSNYFMFSPNGKYFQRYTFSDLEGGSSGIILSIVWDGLRFVMLHATGSGSGSELRIYWSDECLRWAPPPNATGAIVTTDSTGKWYKLATGNKPGEVLLLYYSAASLDGFTNAYHTAHSENGFDVADLNDASITRSNAAAAFTTNGFIFKIKDTWIITASSLSSPTHQISSDKGENWANKQITLSGPTAPTVFGVDPVLGAFVAADNYFAYTADGINWESNSGGYAYYTHLDEVMKSGAIVHEGVFYHAAYYSNQSQIRATDATGKEIYRKSTSGNDYSSKLISIFRGSIATAGYNSYSTYIHKV